MASPVDNSEFSMTVNATEVDGRRPEWVTVSWSGVKHPDGQDVVALYAIGDDWEHKAPVKSLYAVESNSHLKDGSGSFEYSTSGIARLMFYDQGAVAEPSCRCEI